jgi:diguanylate cyclase (GGDEF)-like protein/PAS domain S-box-containing protein
MEVQAGNGVVARCDWDEADRLSALRRYAILGTEAEALFDDLALLAARTCNAPMAVINFIDADRQWFKAKTGLSLGETSLDAAFCSHAIRQSGLFVIPDTALDARFAANPMVAGEPHVRFYAGARLNNADGLPLGTLCVFDSKPRRNGMSEVEMRGLAALARAVTRELELRLQQNFFQLALESMDQGLILIEPDGRLPVINPRAAELLDLPADLVASRPSFSKIATFQAERGEFASADDHIRNVVAQGGLRSTRHEYERTRPNGTVLEVRTVPFPGGGAVRTFTDITKRKKAEAAVLEREARYRALADALPQNVWVADLDGLTVYTNKPMEDYHGPVGPSISDRFDLYHPDDRPAIFAAREAAMASIRPVEVEGRARRRDGEYRLHRITLSQIRHDGILIGWLGMALDIHDMRLAETTVQEQKALLTATLEHMDQGLLMVDAEGIVQVCNQRVIDLLDLSPDLLRSKPRFMDVAMHQEQNGEVADISDTQQEWLVQRFNIFGAPPCYERERPNGTVVEVRTVHLPDGGVVRTYTDITARKKAERAITHIARHDALTGLPNRVVLQEKLDLSIKQLSPKKKVALLLFDLDNFKDVNDTLGHGAGDVALKAVASRLLACLPQDATAIRLGGDEFAILIPEVDNTAELACLAEDVMIALREPLIYEQRDISRRTSIGIALYPDNGRTAGEITKHADIALYAAKRSGRDQALFYAPEFGEAARHRVRVLRNARKALSANAIIPFYQPKIGLSSGEVTGFEALLRWHHPEGGLRSPAEIQEAFEDTDLAVAIGHRMLQRIVADMQVWRKIDCRFGSVALNVSNSEFKDANFAQNVIARLAAAGLGPECLEVEVTESVLLGTGARCVRETLQRFHDGGVAVALDDFGTGYASLSHLNEFPLTWLKIDRSFVEGIGTDKRTEAIVQGVLSLAKSLSIGVVAEGIETNKQMEFLRQRNCELGQGFLFARPMIASRVPHFLMRWKERHSANAPVLHASNP